MVVSGALWKPQCAAGSCCVLLCDEALPHLCKFPRSLGLGWKCGWIIKSSCLRAT